MKNRTIIPLFVLLGTIISCSKESDPEIIEEPKSVEISALSGVSNKLGVYIGTHEIAINIPSPNDYHLQYSLEPAAKAKNTSLNTDTYDVIFNVQDSALILIGIDSLDEVQNATLSEVVLPASDELPPGDQISESVTVYYSTGNDIPWDNISLESDSSEISLIEEGSVISDSTVIVFEEEDLVPAPCSSAHTLQNSYNVFAYGMGDGQVTLPEGWYWIRMSIGFEEDNGEAKARAQKPDIALPVTMNGVSLSMADNTIVEYNGPAGFWEVNAYYCTGMLEVGTYIIVGESYNKGEYVDRATFKLIVEQSN